VDDLNEAETPLPLQSFCSSIIHVDALFEVKTENFSKGDEFASLKIDTSPQYRRTSP
jgi:hypothetical protein